MPRKQIRRRASTRTRGAVFVGLAVLIVAGAFYFSRPKEMAFIEFGPMPSPSASIDGSHAMPSETMRPASGPSDMAIRVDMGGFTPPELKLRSGKATRLLIVNPDNTHHTDGGGWHQLSVPKLGLDFKIPPLTNMVVTIPAAQEGDYEFWCDVCCGGRENPTMQGVIRVRA